MFDLTKTREHINLMMDETYARADYISNPTEENQLKVVEAEQALIAFNKTFFRRLKISRLLEIL
jgi:hypothetical protein